MSADERRFFDACAGIGCFHHGMKKAGFVCVGAAEWNERLRKEYPKAFGLETSRMFGDLHALTDRKEWKDVRKEMMHCVLTAGFPCQPFSKSGPQLGVEHAEGTVFGALVEILLDLKCPGFILENVENLTGPQHKKTFEGMKEVLMNEHYNIAVGKYSPDQIGVPQNRQRWFILGIKRNDLMKGIEDGILLSDMNNAVLSPATPHRQLDLLGDILTTKSMRRGSEITNAEREALLVWDQYLGWMVENKELELPSTMWGMEAKNAYDFQQIQSALKCRKNRPILKSQLLDALKGHRKNQAIKRKMTKSQIVENYLPPYLDDLVKRTKVYPDWKEKHIVRSRKQMLSTKQWLSNEGRINEWKEWYNRLTNGIDSYQKLEWNVDGARPSRTTHSDDTKRLKTRFQNYLIQFRPSGVRVAKQNRHPALVRIGQVPVVGKYLRRPSWQTLTKLQSIPDDFVKNNSRLFGHNGEAIKRLGNAVNVNLIILLSNQLNHHLKER